MTGQQPAARPVPAVGKARSARLPTVAERTLDTGLRVLAVRRPGVPLVELRLRVPFAAPRGSKAVRTHTARATLLAETLLAGTDRHTKAGLAAALQAHGARLGADVDADRLLISGSTLAPSLTEVLTLLGEVLTGATYPADQVDGERERILQDIAIARSQPATLAGEALLQRLYGDHPYGRDLPEVDDVAAVKRPALADLHEARVVPAGSVLVLVGDVAPARALDAVERALSAWARRGKDVRLPDVPALAPGGLVLVDRPGAVQSNLRLGGPALPRTDPGYAALQMASTIFGGYFTSRLVANIREEKGYTYSPRSAVSHPAAGSRFTVEADVATEVTAPALREVLYELGRMVTEPVRPDELRAAQQYATGTLALSTSSQAGLATTLSAFAASGLGVEFLRDHPRALAAVTAEEVLEASQRFLAPTGLAAVVVGDAERVRTGLGALVDLQ